MIPPPDDGGVTVFEMLQLLIAVSISLAISVSVNAAFQKANSKITPWVRLYVPAES
jgi:hypothetical protein